LQTTLTASESAAAAGLTAAFAAWALIPALSSALAAPGAIHVVIDPADGRVLHASPAGQALADALSASSPAALARQVAPVRLGEGDSRLVRLRLLGHRLSTPALCRLALGRRDDGAPVCLVVPTAPVVLPRTRVPNRPEPPPQHAEAAAPVSAPPDRRDRFVWRTDADGRLTEISGSPLLSALRGQTWATLAADRRVGGADGVLAALRERRTFRSEQAWLDLGSVRLPVELSGAPLGRIGSGFGGFGLLRGRLPDEVTLDAADETASAAAALDRPPDRRQEEAESAPDVDEPNPGSTGLSTDEHAAFREIARALGARYAGDEIEPGPQVERPEGGAIMPFPGPTPVCETRDSEGPAPSTQAIDLLSGLPLPALVHTGGAIVAANRPLLELAGYDDLAALAEAGLGRVLRAGDRQAEPGAAPDRTTLMTAQGQARPVEVLTGACTWSGEAASCLLVQSLDEADPAGALAAERLAREAQEARAVRAEATLDALADGIIILDAAGRIVCLNRAAASLFACEPREIVGDSFNAQFDRDSVLGVADILRGTARTPGVIAVAGRPVSLTIALSETDGLRVAVLSPAGRNDGSGGSAKGSESADRTAPDAGGGAGLTLGRLDQAFRQPLCSMIQLAEAMLAEPFGTLGDPRYRGCLADIKATGEAMLEHVGELLDLAAVEAGALQLEPRPIALNDVAATCVAGLQAEAARGRILVRTSFSSDLEDLEADERSVSRAASLVIEHAIRRSTAGGQIIVSTGAADSAAVALRVRNTGAGTAQPPVTSAVEDSLALPRALVEANGGHLRLSGRSEDGTLVEIIMPTRRAANG
jgi:PAS domain-containing protein